jgi:SNF2 family DNA or RNA helicase
MGVITVEQGCLRLGDKEEAFTLSAEEIFAVVFEGVVSLHDVPVSRNDFLSTGLKFCEYAADPTVVLEVLSPDNPSGIECRLVAKGIGFEIDVARYDGSFVDYALNDTTWICLPEGSIEAAKAFLALVGLPGFGPISLGQYLSILQLRDPVLTLEDRTCQLFSASHLASRLRGDIPEGFAGTLYPYQAAGYHWLAFMKRSGLGSIIADEMGLGKTIQVICLLLDAKNTGHEPSLVIGPATLLENWRREIQRFAPALKVVLHRGTRRTGFPEDLRQNHVVLTSYETAVADVSLLRSVTWELLVVDEAQAIKNPHAKRTVRLKTLRSQCVVAMTGTPMENKLVDLWSITDFVVPSLLGSLAEFERQHPETLDGASGLEPILTPMILRRRVCDVAQDLPARIDIPQPLELDSESAEIYEALRVSAANHGQGSLNALAALRMFCTHPWLTNQFTHVASAVDCSVKLERLLQIMEEIVSDNSKTLVFTSYQKSADLLARELAAHFGIHTDVIDGRTPVEERQPKIDRFTEIHSAAVLVLNPRAAGTGLNITAASHVIHFNLEWNPAIEDQASARAHRRGQNQIVTVHRLFYVDTVEDVINDRMARKRQLAEAAVVGTDGKNTDAQDILRSIQISPMNKNRRG